MTRRTTDAFTLVELLVVMAILAVLVALLVPGIRSMMERGARAQSASNMRQIGAAVGFWVAEWHRLPPFRIQDIEYSRETLGGPGQSWTDYSILGQYLGNPRDYSSDGIVSEHSALFTPGDRERNPFSYNLEPGYAITSYGMNTQISGELTPQQVSQGVTLRNFGHPIARITPTRTILAIEAHCNAWNPGWGNPPPCYGLPEPIGGFSWSPGAPNSISSWAMRFRNQQGAHVLFVDGHVEFVAGDELRERVADGSYLLRPPN